MADLQTLQKFIDVLAAKVDNGGFSVNAYPVVMGHQYLVVIENATKKDKYFVDLVAETWVRCLDE